MTQSASTSIIRSILKLIKGRDAKMSVLRNEGAELIIEIKFSKRSVNDHRMAAVAEDIRDLEDFKKLAAIAKLEPKQHLLSITAGRQNTTHAAIA